MSKMPNEEMWKKLEQTNKQLEKYRALYKSDGTITQKEQEHLDALQKKHDEASKALQARIKADAGAEAEKKKKGISADRRDALVTMVQQAATNLSQAARLNAISFAMNVRDACDAFQKYSKSRLDKLKDQVSAADLLGPMISIVTGGIGGALAKGANEVAKTIEDKILKFAEKTMKDKAKNIDKNDLDAAVDGLVAGAKGMADGMKAIVEKEIVERCTKISEHVDDASKGPLDGKLTAFIEPFIRQSPGKVDQLLEQHLGLPSPATAQKTQVEIYKRLVAQFEEKYIIATTPSQERFEWKISGIPPQIQRNAEERGKSAAKKHESELATRAPVGAPR